MFVICVNMLVSLCSPYQIVNDKNTPNNIPRGVYKHTDFLIMMMPFSIWSSAGEQNVVLMQTSLPRT